MACLNNAEYYSTCVQCKHPSGSSTTTLPAFVLDELNTRIRDAVILVCQKKELPVEFSSHDALQSAGEVNKQTVVLGSSTLNLCLLPYR